MTIDNKASQYANKAKDIKRQSGYPGKKDSTSQNMEQITSLIDKRVEEGIN